MWFKILKGIEERFLPRSSEIFHTLSNVTVICVLDKEGLAAEPAPFPEEIAFIRDDITVLETELDPISHLKLKFKDDEWEKFLS